MTPTNSSCQTKRYMLLNGAQLTEAMTASFNGERLTKNKCKMQNLLSRFRVCGIKNQIMARLQIICETYSIQHPHALSHNAIIVISPFYIYFQGQTRDKETNI